MTLIVSALKDNFPVIFGDLLSSTVVSYSRPVNLVSSLEPVQYISGGYGLLGNTQKILILSDTVAVAWAGSAIVALSVIRELEPLLVGFASPEEIYDCFDNMPILQSEKESISIMCHWAEGKEFRRVNINTNVLNTSEMGKIYAAGSGSDHFFTEVLGGITNKGADGSINNAEYLVAYFISLGSMVLYTEATSQQNLKQFYGGGFELLTLDPTPKSDSIVFKKLPLTFLFWNVADDHVTLSGPVNNFSYYGDHLVVFRLLLDEPQEIKKAFVNLIQDPLKRTPLPRWDQILYPELNTMFVVHFLLTENRNNLFIIVKKGAEQPVRFETTKDKGIEIEIEKRFVEEIVDRVNS